MFDRHRPEHGLPGEIPAANQQVETARIHYAVFTKAQLDLAWKVFSDCQLWPTFCDLYGSELSWLGTPWVPGSRLRSEILQPVRTQLDRVITFCSPAQYVAWINHVCGFTMHQCVLFEPYIGGGTKVTTWIELVAGELSADALNARKLVKPVLETWFTGFGAECDRQFQVRRAGEVETDEPANEDLHE